MKYKFYHNNYNVFDLEKSLKFYKEALGLVEVRRRVADDDSFIIVFLGDETTEFTQELTWLRDRDKPYDLGEGEYHLAFIADDFDAAGFTPQIISVWWLVDGIKLSSNIADY